jgi:DNA-directed RNA polymerase subunit omega
MARISNKEGLAHVGGSPYDLIVIAVERARQLGRGAIPLVSQPGSRAMTALREIEQGLVGREIMEEIINSHQTEKEEVGDDLANYVNS